MKKLSRKEAAEVLEDMKVKIEIPKAAVTQWKRNTALDMAIEALNCSEFPNNSDTISRQAAIDAIEKHIDTFDAIDTNYLDGLRTAMNLLHELPSAQPQNENLKFLEFLWNTINPNEMEQYLEMYSSKEVKSNG